MSSVAKKPEVTSERLALFQAWVDRFASQSEAASAIGVSPSTISRALNPDLATNRKLAPLERAAERFDAELQETQQPLPRDRTRALFEPAPAESAAPKHVARSEPALREANYDDAVLVPLDGHASAGPGYENGGDGEADDPRRYVVISREVARRAGANAETLRASTIHGDSLVPDVQPGQIVWYQPGHFIGDGLYIVSLDGLEIAKYVQLRPGGRLVLKSRNRTYDDILLIPQRDADTENTYREVQTDEVCTLRIVGKVKVIPTAA